VVAVVRSILAGVRSPALLHNILAVVEGHSSLDFRGSSHTAVAVGSFGRRTFEVEGIGSLDCGQEEGIEEVHICRPSLVFV